MKSKLFLVCPDCHLEYLIKKTYGDDVFFLTALGAVFNFGEVKYIEALMDFIADEGVTDIFVVNETSCRFIKSIIEGENGFDTFCEDIIKDVLIDNYFDVMHRASLTDKKERLAELNVKQQIREIMSNELFLQSIAKYRVNIKGLVLTAEEKVVNEFCWNI